MRYIKKSDNKKTSNEYRYFLESNFLEVNRFGFIYTNEDHSSIRFKAKRYYLPKGIIDNYNIIINGKKIFIINQFIRIQNDNKKLEN